ncbi:MAG: hypothetical protein BGO76_02450 [Caedibacter sp. 38-128]|nr:hypothetical protein [Holosporales bacterium]OJX07005.1 MAG: hypothetical protein BGO76_02450 [Caedibacter sp. 38-128]
MNNTLILQNFDSSFLNTIKHPLDYLHKGVLKHPFYEHLINGNLKKLHFVAFLEQQSYMWDYFSKELRFLSTLNYPRDINQILLKTANFSLQEASNFNLQLDNFKPKMHELPLACEEYTHFLKKLVERRLTLPILTAFFPRIWLATQLQKRCIKLKAHNHPYNPFIQQGIFPNVEGHTVKIIQLLDAFIQTTSEIEKTEVQKIFLDSALHECELLNRSLV